MNLFIIVVIYLLNIHEMETSTMVTLKMTFSSILFTLVVHNLVSIVYITAYGKAD